MTFVFATSNKHKAAEAAAIMTEALGEKVELLTLEDIGFIGDITESGATFGENAFIKARAAYDFCRIQNMNYGIIADDSGLSVDALGGEPGIYSARYAAQLTGEYGNSSDADNNSLLLKKMKGIENRNAQFVCAICYIDDEKTIETDGCCEGELLESARGEDGFGYDPLFYFPPLKKTLAEVSAEEKNEVSHRSRAFRALCAKLK